MDPERGADGTVADGAVIPGQRDEPHETEDIPVGYRLHNGVLVPAEQPAITRLISTQKPGQKTKRPRPPWSRRRRWLAAGIGLLVVVVISGILASRKQEKLPTDEQAFLAAVHHAAQRVRGGTDVTLVSARMERSREVCRLLPEDKAIQDWRGTIHDIDTAGGDEGVISVSVGDDTELKTGRGVFGADATTELRPGSSVYESVARLHNGDEVVFSGRFVADPDHCIKETSFLARNSMLSPDFEFRFTQVAIK